MRVPLVLQSFLLNYLACDAIHSKKTAVENASLIDHLGGQSFGARSSDLSDDVLGQALGRGVAFMAVSQDDNMIHASARAPA